MDAERATAEELLGQLQQYAARTGTTIAIDRVDGHWRAGFIANQLGEVVFVLHAVGPDESTAIRNLAKIAGQASQDVGEVGTVAHDR